MIRLPLPYLVFVYMLVFLAAIFAVWIVYEMARRLRDGRTGQHRIHCPLCGMEYEDNASRELPRCPRCDSLNERTRVRDF